MRAKLAQIRRVREIRVDSRKREWAAERQKLNEIENQIVQMRQRKDALEREAANRLHQFSAGSQRMSGPEVSALRTTIESLRRESAGIIQQIGAAEKERVQAQRRVKTAQEAMQLAQRAVDQFVRLDERLAEEEAKEFERAEEAENEILPRPKKRPLMPET